MPYKDKDKQREYQRLWAQKHQDEYSETRKKRRHTYRYDAIKLLGSKCKECDCTTGLHFHHMDPTIKEDTISRMVRNVGWDKLKLELKKCILLCESCHQAEHLKLGIATTFNYR